MNHVRLAGEACLIAVPVGGEAEGFLDRRQVFIGAKLADARAQFGIKRLDGIRRQDFVGGRHYYQFVAPDSVRASSEPPEAGSGGDAPPSRRTGGISDSRR